MFVHLLDENKKNTDNEKATVMCWWATTTITSMNFKFHWVERARLINNNQKVASRLKKCFQWIIMALDKT